MVAPLSKTDICNLALDACGQAPIQSIDSPTTETESLLARHYDKTRRSILRKYTCWNFAESRVSITRNAAAPAFDYPDSYNLPQDFLRLMDIRTEFPMAVQSPAQDIKLFTIQGRQLLMNNSGAPSVNIVYIKDVDDITLWDSAFVEVMSLELAMNIAYQITKQAKLVQYLDGLLRLAIADAISIDGQEVPLKRIENSRVLDARRTVYQNAFASPWTEVD